MSGHASDKNAPRGDSQEHSDLPHPNSPHPNSPGTHLPRPIIRKMRWPFPLIWLVPIAALALAGYYAWAHHRDHGPEISIAFKDATGLKGDESQVVYRGVEIGRVESMELSSDTKSAIVHVQLRHDQYSFAENGAQFWIVRPEISETNVSGLGTIFSGPFIQAIPGSGDSASNFVGLDHEPLQAGNGIKVILHTPHLGNLQVETPVHFRGLQVGLVKDIRYSDDSTAVNVTAVIWQRYQDLLRSNSVFWTEKGADVKGGIFSGIKVDIKSLREILTGGISFATPDHVGRPAQDGDSFTLHDEPDKDWLTWAPQIPLEQAAATLPANSSESRSSEPPIQAQVKKQ